MAIDLLNSFLQKGQNVSTNSKSTPTESGQSLPQNLQVMRAIRSLQAGQTLRGEIISVKGEDVQLAILKDVIIDAKLAQSMNLSPGISMPFQVKANNQNGLSLIPLFTNTAADPNAMKALDMAGLPVNERSMEMVLNLMGKGMPIGKQALQESYRDVAMFKDYPVKDIITLRQLHLPISAENLTQLAAYEDNQHFLNNTFSEIGKAIGDHINNLVMQGNQQEVKNFVGKLQQMFQQTESGRGNEQNTVLAKSVAVIDSEVVQNIEGKDVVKALQQSSIVKNTEGNPSEIQKNMLPLLS